LNGDSLEISGGNFSQESDAALLFSRQNDVAVKQCWPSGSPQFEGDGNR